MHGWLVVWNIFNLFHILGIMIPTDFFFRGIETTNQMGPCGDGWRFVGNPGAVNLWPAMQCRSWAMQSLGSAFCGMTWRHLIWICHELSACHPFVQRFNGLFWIQRFWICQKMSRVFTHPITPIHYYHCLIVINRTRWSSNPGDWQSG